MSNQKIDSLEEYNARIEGVYDSLKGFNSATEEARSRCEKARQACRESRIAFEREVAQHALAHPSNECSEREKLESEYRAALKAYDEAINAVLLPAETPDSEERERIDGARNVSRAAIALLEEHKRQHECDRVRSHRGTAIGRAS